MIPLRDNVPTRTFPIVNYSLVTANAAVFIHELSLRQGIDRFILRYSLVPARLSASGAAARLGLRALQPLFTSMFLHGGWLHIIANMWVLLIFGDNIEDRLGHARYLAFYLLCGVVAAATHLWASWGSNVPALGASGAIAGVMGAFLILYPFAQVTTLVPIFIFIRAIELPASLYLGLWLWSQIYAGRLSLTGAAAAGGVAWWEHIGGFLAGVVLLGLFLPAGERPRGSAGRRSP